MKFESGWANCAGGFCFTSCEYWSTTILWLFHKNKNILLQNVRESTWTSKLRTWPNDIRKMCGDRNQFYDLINNLEKISMVNFRKFVTSISVTRFVLRNNLQKQNSDQFWNGIFIKMFNRARGVIVLEDVMMIRQSWCKLGFGVSTSKDKKYLNYLSCQCTLVSFAWIKLKLKIVINLIRRSTLRNWKKYSHTLY